MKILQITKKFPYPVIDGEVIAIMNLTKGFAELGHEITVLSLNTKRHFFNLEKLPDSIRKLARFIAVDIDTTIKPFDAFLNLFSSKSYNVERFYSTEFGQKISELLTKETFDLILFEGVYLMRYIQMIKSEIGNQKPQTPVIVLRPHNVEFMIWERLAENEKNIFKKMYLKILTQRMKKFELKNMNRADLLIPVSEMDMNFFVQQGCSIPHAAFPIGYEFESLPVINETEENAIAFIGGMDWLPNREGVDWFINKVWIKILVHLPDAEFYLAGRNFPDEVKSLRAKGVVILGEVEDAKQFISSKSVFIVPLFSASGMRVKIIEAMALGRAIVSTSIGAEGIAYTHGKDILIANDADTFAEAILKILRNRDLRMQLGIHAQQLVKEKYDNRKICNEVIEFCKPHLN